MKERFALFNKKGGVKSHPCGKIGFLEKVLKKPTYIKNLDGEILYEGRGPFQKVLENAVSEGVELPNADLRERRFSGLKIPYAQMPGASFENSGIVNKITFVGVSDVVETASDLSNADLRKVSFKNTFIDEETIFRNSDVAEANFDGHRFNKSLYRCFHLLKNLDKAKGVKKADLDDWKEIQLKLKPAREKEIEIEAEKRIKRSPHKALEFRIGQRTF